MIPTDPDTRTILDRCDELATYSASPTGIDRRYLTPQHAAVNALVAGWLEQAGLLRTWQDAAGNQWGRLEGFRPGLPALVLGSHLDSVPDAGRYDGILGVTVAVQIAERLRSNRLPFALEVVAFGDEEGSRFGATLLGSRAVAGSWDAAWWELVDEDGLSLADAFTAFGLDPARVGEAARSRDSLVGYLEPHIEQGPLLEEADRSLAVVSGIAGATRALVTLEGEARHCATPYAARRDAMLGACEQILAVDEIARAAGCYVTMGHLAVEPDAVNVVAGQVTYSIDLRSPDDDLRATTWARLCERIEELAAARRLGVSVQVTHSARATTVDPRLAQLVRAGIQATGDADPMMLPSIAGHDTMAMADLCEVAMLFVRCGGGISHHPDESVRAQDVAAAVTALERTVLDLAEDHQTDAIRDTA